MARPYGYDVTFILDDGGELEFEPFETKMERVSQDGKGSVAETPRPEAPGKERHCMMGLYWDHEENRIWASQ